ncbi:MAG: xrtA [Sphingomonas bacterium]|nr:exosortase A [Sphingomonas bacterium]MDB5689891.1 xrtA [Sphingomonas bacterium]
MNVAQPIAAARPAPPLAGQLPLPTWRRHLAALALMAAGLLLCFHRDLIDMVGQWWNSSTYGHCLFLPPIIAWLVRQRLPALRQMQPVAWWPGLLLVGAGAAGWLLGDAAGVALARQYGFVLMLQGAVVACLGPSVSRGLLFPLAYALLLVPAGEELVPPLQTLTAAMCMRLLALVGVPAHIDGVFITIPNGYFEVAEACSGVKFLVAMVAYATLVAHVCFRSPLRRSLFLAAALALPVVANGLRAWGTIYVAYLTDSDFASSFDHVVYGWVFFGTVMIALMAAAWPFFDRGVDGAWIDPARLQPRRPAVQPPRRVMAVTAAALALAVTPLLWSAIVDARGEAAAPRRIALPQVPGWVRSAAPAGPAWQPHFAGADQLLVGHYRDAAGRPVDLAFAVFDRQREGRELVGFGQGAIAPGGPWAWTAEGRPLPGGRAFRILSPGPVVREVAIFYLLGDVTTGSDLRVKIETLKARLLGRSQRGVAVLASAPQIGDVSARGAIDDFLRALGPVDRIAGMGAN